MCSICNQFSCPLGCPNYRELGAYACHLCGDGICNGESYYKIGASYFHKECLLDSYDKEELLSLLGALPRIATDLKIACVLIGEADGK